VEAGEDGGDGHAFTGWSAEPGVAGVAVVAAGALGAAFGVLVWVDVAVGVVCFDVAGWWSSVTLFGVCAGGGFAGLAG